MKTVLASQAVLVGASHHSPSLGAYAVAYIVLAVVVVAASVTLAVQLRKHAPPEPARLLPGGDGFFYLDLGRVRKLNSGNKLPPVSHDPEYDRFLRETGFEFERDLEEAAV